MWFRIYIMYRTKCFEDFFINLLVPISRTDNFRFQKYGLMEEQKRDYRTSSINGNGPANLEGKMIKAKQT